MQSAAVNQPQPFPRIGSAEQALDWQATLLDEVESGLIVCDEAGVIRYANSAARRELAAGRAVRSMGEFLRRVAHSGPDLEASLRQAARKGKRALLWLGTGKDRLMVSVQPVRRPCSDLGLELLAASRGLTWAERRVMAALIGDASPRQIAAECSIAMSTVRSHISSIRNKLDARSIDAVLLRAAEVPPVANVLRFARMVPEPA
jgi:DNA-binding CsgD family transcriptional regulator